MTQLWQLTKNMMSWLPIHQEEPCHLDEDDPDVQESSGIGTITVIYTALAGLFLGANLIARHMSSGTESLRKEQQRRRSKLAAQKTRNNRSKRVTNLPENWQDAQEPTDDDEVLVRLTVGTAKLSGKETYVDLPSDRSEVEQYVDAIEQE